MSDHKRLFVGARVAVGVANSLSGAAETLARRARDAGVDIRWVAPVNYHVTLAFLGNTRVDAIAAVVDALEAATTDTQRIAFKTSRLGAFPSIDKGRVVWAGIDDQGALGKVAARVGQGLVGLGVVDRKPFHAHVTLGRLRETRPLKELVLPMAEQMFGETRIDGITLFESETKSAGSVYRELARIPFKTAEMGTATTAERQTLPLDQGAQTLADSSFETDDGWPRGHRTD
jgi:RNA 2',3'-cyclic 3'-phosphodiesterase